MKIYYCPKCNKFRNRFQVEKIYGNADNIYCKYCDSNVYTERGLRNLLIDPGKEEKRISEYKDGYNCGYKDATMDFMDTLKVIVNEQREGK